LAKFIEFGQLQWLWFVLRWVLKVQNVRMLQESCEYSFVLILAID
jgi:hypothetical protein